MQTNHRAAFSSTEVFIVLVAVVVLGAAIIPRLAISTYDTKLSAGRFHTHTLRSQIERYRTDHAGQVPSETLVELTTKTDFDGTCNPENGAFGPYLDAVPLNPLTQTNTVTPVNCTPITTGHLPTGNLIRSTAGWLYNPGTGELWANHTDMITF